MATVLATALPGGVEPPAAPAFPPRRAAPAWPAELASALWRGSEMASRRSAVVASGFDELDPELPGGGWPCNALTEVLSPQPAVLEWRLLGPALRRVVSAGGQVVIVGPPRVPHLPGLRHAGIDDQHLVWVQAETLAERLWCTEQLVRSQACGALLAWLPQARPEQIRRLQVCAQGCDGPVFLLRPAAARREASAAPLRVMATFDVDWAVQVQVFKRSGPVHDGWLRLPCVPGGLSSVLTPRLQRPSRFISSRVPAEVPDAVGRAVPPARPRRHTAVP